MTKKLYGHARARDLDSYCDHLLAMTGEELHSKADIACELAWRDERFREATHLIELILHHAKAGRMYHNEVSRLKLIETTITSYIDKHKKEN